MLWSHFISCKPHSQEKVRDAVSLICFDLLYFLIHREEEILILYQKGTEGLVLLGNTNIRWDLVCVFVCILTTQTFCETTHEKQYE